MSAYKVNPCEPGSPSPTMEDHAKAGTYILDIATIMMVTVERFPQLHAEAVENLAREFARLREERDELAAKHRRAVGVCSELARLAAAAGEVLDVYVGGPMCLRKLARTGEVCGRKADYRDGDDPVCWLHEPGRLAKLKRGR